MADFTLEQLRQHFGSECLIGRITILNKRKGFGLVTAFQEDTGEKWRYPDGGMVNDILVTFDGDTHLNRHDWVLIQGYELAMEPSPEGRPVHIKAVRTEPLAEAGGIREILDADSVTPPHRMLAGAIQCVRTVGEKVLIVQGYLETERERIETGIASEKARLEERDSELAKKQEALDAERRKLRDDRLVILTDKEQLDRDREKLEERQRELQEAGSAFQNRLQRYGLEEESIESGDIQLSDDLIALLMAQERIRKTLKDEKFDELVDLENEIEQRRSALAAEKLEIDQLRETLASKETETARREEELQQREEENRRLEQDLEELREILVPTKARRTKPTRSVLIHQFDSEKALLAHVKQFVQDSGFHYDDWIVEDFYTCLKVGYLTVLSGISGAGKSKLPYLFASAVDGAFELIPVRPDWNDDRDLLGFFNFRRRTYQSTRFVEFLQQANEDPDRLYIACLDEMNLAPVEYYFAQLLSVLETDVPSLSPPDESLTGELIDQFQERALIEMERLQDERSGLSGVAREAVEREIRLWGQMQSDLEKYQEVPIPGNIRFVGTVNVDHTTHGFSDKVLDRANVIQFERVDLSVSLKRKPSAAKGLSYTQFAAFCDDSGLTKDQEQRVEQFVTQLRDINHILEPGILSVGFRILQEVRRYMCEAIRGDYFDRPETAFDFQVKQRILPKIRGMRSKELEESLEKLATFLQKEGYSRSHEKVAGRQRDGKVYGGMLQQLAIKGYVNYWEIR